MPISGHRAELGQRGVAGQPSVVESHCTAALATRAAAAIPLKNAPSTRPPKHQSPHKASAISSHHRQLRILILRRAGERPAMASQMRRRLR